MGLSCDSFVAFESWGSVSEKGAPTGVLEK